MKFTYDPQHNIAYIRLKEKNSHVQTISVSHSLNVDIAADGTVYGIELLNANKQLKQKGKSKLFFQNIATGRSVEVDLLKK